MQTILQQRVAALGLILPQPAPPAANYIPAKEGSGLLFIAGQIPQRNGQACYIGRVGQEITVADAQDAAGLCALQILAQVDAVMALAPSGRAVCMRIGGFVRCREDFTDIPIVMNGASDLLVAALGADGKHARTAVGVGALPRGVAVEVDAVFALYPEAS